MAQEAAPAHAPEPAAGQTDVQMRAAESMEAPACSPASQLPDLKIGDILGNSDIPEAAIIERLKAHAKKKGFVPVLRCEPGRRRIRMTCKHAGLPAMTAKCCDPKVRLWISLYPVGDVKTSVTALAMRLCREWR